MSDEGEVFHFKLVFLGDANVGKTSLAVRFAKNEYRINQEPSIGANFMTQAVHIGVDIVKLEMWDTAGQERYKSMAPMYYRGASSVVVVYDVTSQASFESAKSTIDEVKGVVPVIALAGNKADLTNGKVVDPSAVQELMQESGVLFFETSALNGLNVRTIFTTIAERLRKQFIEEASEGRGAFQVTGQSVAEDNGAQAWCCV